MPNTIEQVNALMRSPAYENRWQGGPWHNRCEQFTNNLGAFTQGFATALLAAQASGDLDADLTHIRDGAVGYWSGVWLWDKILKRFVECGHTAFWYRGRWLMASDAVTEKVGNGTGTITHADYTRLRPAAKWLGWSMRHGRQTLAVAGTSTAGSDRPIDITSFAPRDRTQDVETIRRALSGDIFNLADQFIKHLNTDGQAAVSAAVQYENDRPHNLNEAEFAEIIDAYGIPRTQVYGLGTGLPVGHVWSAEHAIRAATAEAIRIANVNFTLLEQLLASPSIDVDAAAVLAGLAAAGLLTRADIPKLVTEITDAVPTAGENAAATVGAIKAAL